MMKQGLRLLACVLALMMTASCAMAVTKAAQPLDTAALERYPAYTLDAETGKWSVRAYQADALVDRLWTYDSRNSSFATMFYLAAEGDARTGVWTPVLKIYAVNGYAIEARAISILADDRRVDLAASSAHVSNGRQSAEVITVPLNAAAWDFVSGLAQAETATLRLIGKELYTIEINAQTAANERRLMEAESLRQLSYGVELMNGLGIESYGLWDLSAADWEQAYGYRPAMTTAQMTETVNGAAVTDTMGMVLPDVTSDAAEAAQKALVQYGFFSGTAARRFDDNAIAATLRAQKYLGRVETGCFDDALLDAMAQGVIAQAQEEASLQAIGSAVQVDVDRFWFAKGISASANPDTLRSVVNQDNVFLAADGTIVSLCPEDMHLFVEMEANVIYNGQYAYQAELALEGSDGTALDTLLLPLAQARLIAYAEIPAALANDAEADWCLLLTHGSDSLTIELQ